MSTLNSHLYSLEGALSHLVRTHEFLDRLDERQESSGDRSVSSVEEITFDDVTFRYTDDERVLDGVSFDVDRGEFVAFVGQSSAGKSTIVSLLARLYQPDSGEIRADGVPIGEFDLQQWRERIAVTDGESAADEIADETLMIPKTSERAAPVLANVQLQLFSYHLADELGRPIDKPRNLAKSVTVE